MPRRVCANPRCGRPLPVAHTTQRHCGPACRQARHRDRQRPAAGPAVDTEELSGELARLAARLADQAAALASSTLPAHDSGSATSAGSRAASADASAWAPRYASRIRPLLTAVDALLEAAVAHDRACGDSWPAIAADLHLHPEAARRRFRHRTADRPRDQADDSRGGTPQHAS